MRPFCPGCPGKWQKLWVPGNIMSFAEYFFVSHNTLCCHSYVKFYCIQQSVWGPVLFCRLVQFFKFGPFWSGAEAGMKNSKNNNEVQMFLLHLSEVLWMYERYSKHVCLDTFPGYFGWMNSFIFIDHHMIITDVVIDASSTYLYSRTRSDKIFWEYEIKQKLKRWLLGWWKSSAAL